MVDEKIHIIDYKTLNMEDLSFENPVKIKGGSYISLISYKDKPLYIQTPRLINNKGFLSYLQLIFQAFIIMIVL